MQDRPQPTIAARRSFMNRYLEFVAPGLEATEFRRETVDAGGVQAEWCIPAGSDEGRVVLYVHGGGFVMGSPQSHYELAGRVARSADAVALVVDYRLAPEHPWPAAVDDVASAYRWLLGDAKRQSKLVGVAADSAGGAIALSALIKLLHEGDPMPAGVVLMSPWVGLDITEDLETDDPVLDVKEMREFAKMYIGELLPDDPRVSPLYADLSGLSPILVHVGSREAVKGDSLRLVKSAEAGGVQAEVEVWEGMVHGWQLAPQVPEAVGSTQKLGSFLAECFGGEMSRF